jgi:hypothetical protein
LAVSVSERTVGPKAVAFELPDVGERRSMSGIS